MEKINRSFQAAVFDMDGLILDSALPPTGHSQPSPEHWLQNFQTRFLTFKSVFRPEQKDLFQS